MIMWNYGFKNGFYLNLRLITDDKGIVVVIFAANFSDKYIRGCISPTNVSSCKTEWFIRSPVELALEEQSNEHTFIMLHLSIFRRIPLAINAKNVVNLIDYDTRVFQIARV